MADSSSGILLSLSPLRPKIELSSSSSQAAKVVERSDQGQGKLNPPPSKIKLGPPPSQVAKVIELADQGQANNETTSPVEQRILDRIKKCLDRAKHPNTPEAEAHASWRMASHLMGQYNVTQAEIVEQKANDNDCVSLGGQSVVEIVSTKADAKRVISPTWARDIAIAMTIFFDCKTYSARHRRRKAIDQTFYGISANTVAAAIAFEMAHNLTLEWARKQKGRNTKHSYCLGIGKGLMKIARKEKKLEKQRVEEMEKSRVEEEIEKKRVEEQQAALARFRQPRVSSWPDSDEKPTIKQEDCDDNDEYNGFFSAQGEDGNITDDYSDMDDQAISENKKQTTKLEEDSDEDLGEQETDHQA